MVKISDLIFNPQSNTLDSFLDNSLFNHAFLDKRPLLKQDPLLMVFGIEDALDKIDDEMTTEIFKERLLLDNMLLLHQHLPPFSQVKKDYAPFVMVITGDKDKQAVRAVRVSKVVSALMLPMFQCQSIYQISSAYHPQTDGQTERVNQIWEEMLRHYIQQRLASWEEYLPLVEFAYNNAPHSITGMTPFQAAYGHTPLVPTNFVLQHKVALTDQLVQEMQDMLVQVRDKLVHVQQKYQKQANKHRRHAELNEGDLVLLYVASHRYKTVK
ncbi:hypothetical protein L7F22_020175 [Adiantum nelumboides]|nr:hypothetical protein [Adiantum nelumboides]